MATRNYFKYYLLLVLVLLLQVAYVNTCGGGYDTTGTVSTGSDPGTGSSRNGGRTKIDRFGNDGNKGNNGGGPKGDPLSKLLGGTAKGTPYNNGFYENEGGGPVSNGADLDCDFEGDCCWVDTPEPEDEIDWALIQGKPDSSKMKSLFGTSEQPSGNFLATGASKQSQVEEARFAACSIDCAQEITLTMRHWSTSGIDLSVCTQDTFAQNPASVPLQDCVPLGSGPGPTTVSLPGGNLLDIVILAEGFNTGSENIALIDDIIVDFIPCDDDDNGDGGGGGGGNGDGDGDGDECNAECSFEGQENCVWIDGKSGGIKTSSIKNVDEAFEVHTGQFQNRVTGVKEASDGSSYIATYLYPGETAALEAEVETSRDVVLCFDHYEATSSLMLEVYLDGSPVYSTDPLVSVVDRQWLRSCVLVPQGTQVITFLATNTGKNQGAAAIDHVVLLEPAGSNPDDAVTSIC